MGERGERLWPMLSTPGFDHREALYGRFVIRTRSSRVDTPTWREREGRSEARTRVKGRIYDEFSWQIECQLANVTLWLGGKERFRGAGSGTSEILDDGANIGGGGRFRVGNIVSRDLVTFVLVYSK